MIMTILNIITILMVIIIMMVSVSMSQGKILVACVYSVHNVAKKRLDTHAQCYR